MIIVFFIGVLFAEPGAVAYQILYQKLVIGLFLLQKLVQFNLVANGVDTNATIAKRHLHHRFAIHSLNAGRYFTLSHIYQVMRRSNTCWFRFQLVWKNFDRILKILPSPLFVSSLFIEL